MVTEKIKLYFGDAGNENIVSEERQISYPKGGDRYNAALEELVRGPQNKSHRANISPDTKVYGTIKQGSDLIVDFSKEFNRFGGSVAEIVAVGSVVNTAAQFGDVKRVKILVEGSELIGPSGEPRGFMEPFTALKESPKTETVVLYFGNKDATGVVGEARELTVPAGAGREEFVKKVLEELIKGPQRQDLVRTIPGEVKILSVKIEDKTTQVDFSKEMHTRHWGGAAGEAATINSIANTLTEFDYISRVKMTVEGEPMAIEHAVLEKPVGRNESVILTE
jgi:germination protein M